MKLLFKWLMVSSQGCFFEDTDYGSPMEIMYQPSSRAVHLGT